MSNNRWQETNIWKRLSQIEGQDAEDVKIFLSRPEVMSKIESVLNKSHTEPLAFTLHDADHSFRVANRMLEILTEKTFTALTPYDLCYLLLSAYLHDIGMTPDADKVNRHFNFFLSRKKNTLTPDDLKTFQIWLDDHGIIIDYDKEKVTHSTKELNQAKEVITYYCRDRHNDWSGQWILENLGNLQFKEETWIDFLISICQSHHTGLDVLIESDFDITPMGQSHLHRRLVAMCLRVADVMEIDPERTPKVIFQHRDIPPKSIPFWHKDSNMKIIFDKGDVRIDAKPQTAVLHKAVLDTIDDIERELKLCYDLAHLKPLNVSDLFTSINYEWTIFPSVYQKVEPFQKSYEYIDGTFRPKTDKILELLGGTELYENPLLAIRELLQNAFDAVKENIALYLLQNSITEESEIIAVRRQHKVQLSLEQKGEEIWLHCSDNGVGMNKNIINKFFLVSGASHRHELIDLERRCQKAGFSIERTGQFGIGVLSYFMIATSFRLITKRSQLTDDSDVANAYEFTISGLSDFGELKKKSKATAGTDISLLIKDNITDKIEYSISSLEPAIQATLQDILSRIPCKFEFGIKGSQPSITLEPGWVFSEIDNNHLLKELETEFFPNDQEYSYETEEFINRRKSDNELLDTIKSDFIQRLKWITKEGITTEKIPYRVRIPYFELGGGKSFCYFWENQDKFNPISKSGAIGYYPSETKRTVSWKGFKISNGHETQTQYNYTLYIDILDSKYAKINAARSRMRMNTHFSAIQKLINEEYEQLITEDFGKGKYALLNHYQRPSRLITSDEAYWIFENSKCLQKISAPFLLCTSYFSSPFEGNLYYKGDMLTQLAPVDLIGNSSNIPAAISTYNLSRLVLLPSGIVGFVQEDINNLYADVNTYHFLSPPEYKDILLYTIDYRRSSPLINASNAIFEDFDLAEYKEYIGEIDIVQETEKALDSFLYSFKTITYFLVYFLNKGNSSLFQYITENRPDFFERLWGKISKFSETEKFYSVANGDYYELIWVEFSKEGLVRKEYNETLISKTFPTPSSEWHIQEVSDSSAN